MSRKSFRAAAGFAAALFSASLGAQTFDDPAGAQTSPVGDGVYAFNSAGYTLAGPALSCNGLGSDANDVWLSYIAPATATVIFTVCPSSGLPGGSIAPNDSALAVWDDTGFGGLPGAELDCQDGGGNCGGTESEVTLSVTAGSVYYVQLTNWGSSQVISGNLAIGQLILPPAFMTDDCSTAPLASEGIYGYNGTGFTLAGPIPSCTIGNSDQFDCWMAYTPSATGLATFSTCAASTLAPGGGTVLNVDTTVIVWDGTSCPPTTELGCGDGSPNCFNGQGEVSVSVTAGNTYYVQVTTWGATGNLAGNLAIALFLLPPSVFTDDCSTAPLVSDGVWAYSSSGAIAGPQASCSGQFGPDTNDCWVAYTPSTSGIAIFSNCATSTLAPGGSTVITTDTYIAVWDGTSCPPTTELACGDGSPNCFNGESETSFPVTAGNTYYVQVGAWGPTQTVVGSMAIAVFVPPPPAGPGDDCTVAVPHPTGAPIPYNSAGFTTPGPSANCAAFVGFDAFDFWYVFTAPATGIAVASNCGASTIAPGGSSSGGSYLAAWDGTTCPPSTQIACNNGAPNCSFPGGAEVQFNVVAGSTYYVQVGEWGNSAPSSGAVNIVILLPPANDDCINATPIGLGTTSGTNIGATTSSPTGSCGGMGSDVWFSLVVPCSGKLILDMCGSSYDTAIAVFDNCPGVQLGCNDDSGSNGPCQFTLQSYLEINGLTAGQVIYIAAGGFVGQQGSFNLNVKCDYNHAWTVPVGPGSIQLENVDGPANAIAFSAITVDILHPGLPANVNFPNGWFFGVPIGFGELQLEISWPGGLPFTGVLNGSGYLLNFTLPAGTTTGLAGIATIWSVGVALDPATGFASIADLTDPTAFAL